MKLAEIASRLARPRYWQSWGFSHGNSSAISGEAARSMAGTHDAPDELSHYQYEEPSPRRGRHLARAFLKAILDSPGTTEPLYHGFENRRGIQFRPGQTITIPLTSTAGSPDTISYGIRQQPDGPAMLFAFPIGTKFAGYSRWKKEDQITFGYTWAEAIVGGRFQVVGIETKPIDSDEYEQVNLQPVAYFDPDSRAWGPA